MAGAKIGVEFQVQKDLVKMLEFAAEKYKLGDKGKALRCILDYIATDADWDGISKQSVAYAVAPMAAGYILAGKNETIIITVTIYHNLKCDKLR